MFLKITHIRRLQECLYRIPEGIPSGYQRYIIVSNFMFFFATVGHSGFIPIYALLGAPHALVFNILCPPLDILCLYLNHRRRYRLAFGIFAALVTVHTIQSSLTFGWSSGFHYYTLSLSVFIFMAPWRKLPSAVLLGFLIAICLWLGTRWAQPVETLPQLELSAIRTCNIIVNFIILGYLAGSHALAAQKTQDALEENRITLQTILAASPVGLAMVKQRRIHWTNDTLLEMLGYSRGEEVDPDVIQHVTNQESVNKVAHLAYEVGQPVIDLPERRLKHKDGTLLDCHIKIRPINPKNSDKGSIVVIIDTTAQKAAAQEKALLQAKYRRAEKMELVGTLAGGVAHDLNNILSGIQSYPDLLLMDLPDDAPMRKPLETIKRSGEKAAAIVQDLLTLARRGVNVREVVDLNTVVTEYSGSPEYDKLLVYHPGVQIDIRLSEQGVYVNSSTVHLLKTLMNLVSNACEAMPDGGLVTITTDRRILKKAWSGYDIVPAGNYSLLSVADTGPGIAAEDLDKIFEPFFTKKVMGRSGTGLGLPVVWGTVKDSGGYVDLVSIPGAGTRFDLYFPVPSALASEAAASHAETLGGNGELVLVVDDVEEQRIIVSGMLAKLGYKVETVSSGEAAVAWLKDHDTDLLVLDMIMAPGIDGLETYRRILTFKARQKAVIASGYSDSDRVAQARALGASGFLKKPYSFEELGCTVRQALVESQDHPG